MTAVSKTGLWVIIALLFAGSAAMAGSPSFQWSYGPNNGQLRMGAAIDHNTPAGHPPDLLILIENIGKKDLTLNLGMSLGNGALYELDGIELTAIDAKGRVHYYHYAGRVGAIDGRVDPFVVPLPPGAAYQMRFSLSRFWEDTSPKPPYLGPAVINPPANPGLWPNKGKYKMLVSLKTLPLIDHNLDTHPIEYVNADSWVGELTSGPVTCSIP